MTRPSPTTTTSSRSIRISPKPTTIAATPGTRRASTTRPSRTSTKPGIKLKDADAYVNRGIAWDNKGEYDKAIADYNLALAINPQFALAYNNRGLAWYKKGEYDKAIADFNEVERFLDPSDAANIAATYNSRGLTWYGKGEYDKAIADFKQALAINPEFALAYNNRGLAWQQKRRIRQGHRRLR